MYYLKTEGVLNCEYKVQERLKVHRINRLDFLTKTKLENGQIYRHSMV